MLYIYTGRIYRSAATFVYWTPHFLRTGFPMASITPHKNGWRAQVYVSGVRDSRVLRTQREAKAWAAARETELQEEKGAAPGDLYTVRQMLERYAKEVSVGKQGARHEGLRIQAFLRDFPDLADKILSQFATPDLAAWRDTRLKSFTAPDGRQVRSKLPHRCCATSTGYATLFP